MLENPTVKLYQTMEDIENHKDFWHPGNPHVVGINLQVHYVSNVNTIEQSFQAGLYVSHEWQPSKEDVEEWMKLKEEGRIEEFRPEYIPQFRFSNGLEFETREYRKYLDGTTFSLLVNGEIDTRGAEVTMQQDYMISARLSIRGSFGEPFQLQEFPFDVQDMKIIIASTANAHTQILVPHFRRNEFVKIQMQVSSLPEWTFDQCLVEFVLSDPAQSSRGDRYSTCTLNCKLVRKWKSYIKRVNVMMAAISCTQFTVFSLDAVEKQAERLSNSFALMLTGLIFIFVAANSLPNVPYLTQLDEYIYALFFLMLLMSV